jgi:hypothetical protein
VVATIVGRKTRETVEAITDFTDFTDLMTATDRKEIA